MHRGKFDPETDMDKEWKGEDHASTNKGVNDHDQFFDCNYNSHYRDWFEEPRDHDAPDSRDLGNYASHSKTKYPFPNFLVLIMFL